MCLVVLGLAYLVDRISSRPWPHPGTPVLRLIVFGATTVVFLRAVSFGGRFKLSSGGRRRSVALFLLSLILTAGAVWLARTPLKLTVAVFLSAWVEEVVFRRELPAALTPHARAQAVAGARSPAILLAQVTFAACHFVVGGNPAPFGNGLPFVSLFASGGFLAVLFRVGGLPLAVAAHFVLNEFKRTGQVGSFLAPSSSTALLCATAAVLVVVMLEQTERVLLEGSVTERGRHLRAADQRPI